MILESELDTLKYWVRERDHIRNLKELNMPKPWTHDPILQNYKFCNVKREDDAVTKWFAKNWRHPKFWDEENFVAAIILGRTINWPYTLERLGFPSEFAPIETCRIMDEIQESGKKVYTGAYMITAGPTGVRKNEWVINNALSYFRQPPVLDPRSIQKSWEAIIAARYPCVGPFIAGQVIADLKQTKHLHSADDWWVWAAIGPGSARGLNRLHGRDLRYPINQKHGLQEMREVREAARLTDLCLQDVQNCLCEFDKYSRVLKGQGKPRSGYQGI
jgi:hypothetical protein